MIIDSKKEEVIMMTIIMDGSRNLSLGGSDYIKKN
jgi:hypothetical protein